MRPRKTFPDEWVEDLRRMLREAREVDEFKRIQCVWLRSALGLSVEQIAVATGLAPASVRCFHSRFIKQGPGVLRSVGRGGRRRQNLTVEQEAALLEKFFNTAEHGGILEVGKMKSAYEQAVGRKVPRSTVYRMLARHGWRKLAPRPRHPKSDPRAQEEFKKNPPRLRKKGDSL